ncbi:hypothetical protein [Virgibacillus halodenitrificans]|uniref:hypothetical protein n=1 Tax=Virgibacillus halodenitrificans TaxID=1482 RepID=UPI000EF5583E|nr:hypothetical protein [Virgibacillus halodenitrificans]
MNNIDYKLTIDYNYDLDNDKIIETRCVKRIFDNKCTEYLKANFQILEREYVPSDLYESVKNVGLYSYDLPLTQNELDKIMEQTYNIFSFDKGFDRVGKESFVFEMIN